MTASALHRPQQWITNKAGRWSLTTPPEAKVVAPPRVVVAYAPPAPQAGVDKMGKFDKEQGAIKYNDKSHSNKELNDTAFENDIPWGRRQSKANVGYVSIKSSFRR